MGYNEQLEDQIDHHFIGRSELTKKKQMGGVGWLINGNMCCGIYEDLLVVRVDPSYLNYLSGKQGIERFNQESEDQQNIISIKREIYKHPKALRKFLSHAYEFTVKLPPKNDSNLDEI